MVAVWRIIVGGWECWCFLVFGCLVLFVVDYLEVVLYEWMDLIEVVVIVWWEVFWCRLCVVLDSWCVEVGVVEVELV